MYRIFFWDIFLRILNLSYSQIMNTKTMANLHFKGFMKFYKIYDDPVKWIFP